MDAIDRLIINELQGGFPIVDRPFADAGARLGITEDELIERVGRLRIEGILSRFGPLYNAERFGGAVTLAAMKIPDEDFERIAAKINVFPEVAHNYARDHEFNMWFVVAVDRSDRIDKVLREIELAAGYRVYNFPKLEEFYVGLHFAA